MLSIVCVGIIEAEVVVNVNELPNENDIVNAERLDIISGGGAINAAINLSKIGAQAAVCGKIGKDIFGRFLLNKLHNAGVNTDGLLVSDSLATPSSVVFKTPNNQSVGARHKGANSDFSLSDINWAIVEKSDMVYVSGLMSLAKFNSTACEMFLQRCRHMGKLTVLDVKPDCTDLSEAWRAELLGLLKYIDYFLPGYDEAVALTGHKLLEDVACELAAKGAGVCVIRCGVKGSYVKESPYMVGYMLPAYKNISIVDKTGAGDAFCSGFVYGLSKCMSVRHSALIGNAAGAMCVTEADAAANVKPYSEIKKFMERTAT